VSSSNPSQHQSDETRTTAGRSQARLESNQALTDREPGSGPGMTNRARRWVPAPERRDGRVGSSSQEPRPGPDLERRTTP
jgi:hypothetical protein